MNNRNFKIINWIIILGFPIFFFLWNSSKYNGPAILTDEIGYLSNAIFLSGYHIDGGSSYHAGFSLLLAPLFLFFHDTGVIWKGAMVINSALWCWTFYSVHRLLSYWSKETSPNERVLTLLLISIYPTWITISGYVFTSSLFTSLFMAGLLSFISVVKNEGRGIYLLIALTGILYWVHPIGAMTEAASIIALGIYSYKNKKLIYPWATHTIACIILFFLYKNLLHPIIINSMTPEGHSPISHYPSTSKILKEMKEISFWVQLAVHSLGQIAYLLVSSLGIALFGGSNLFNYIIKAENDPNEKWKNPISVYVTLSILAIILIGAVNFSLLPLDSQRSDHWIYGRYLDNVSIPILAIGILNFIKIDWRKRLSHIPNSLFIVLLAGLSISLIHKTHPPIAYSEIISIPSFWPHYSFPEMKDVGFWLLIGTSGIVFVYMTGKAGLYLCTPIVFSLGLIYQTKYHKEILKEYAAPSGIVDIIKKNYSPQSSISFDLDSANGRSLFFKDRISINKYYLYNYNYRRVSKSGWETEKSDLILTYSPSSYTNIGFEVASEIRSGLSLVKKHSNHPIRISEEMKRGVILKVDQNGAIPEGITFNANELINWSQVGVLRDGSIYTKKQGGYLFYGPYLYLKKGEYELTIHGDFSEISSASLDVVSAASNGKILLKESLSDQDTTKGFMIFKLSLSEDAPSLEIRLLVTNRDNMNVNRYVIKKSRLF